MKHNPIVQRLIEEKEAGIGGGLYHYTQINMSYNSNKIEGSRLSEEQTRLIFETNSFIAEPEELVNVDDVVETLNHFKAFDFVLEELEHPLTIDSIQCLHRMLKQNTRQEKSAGKFKIFPNTIGSLKETAQPEEVYELIEALVKEFNQKETHVLDDIISFHVSFERIHPFQDGNGRVGRLIMFQQCLQNGHIPFIIRDENKAFYYRGLERYDQEPGYLIDTCLLSQDQYSDVCRYFRVLEDDR